MWSLLSLVEIFSFVLAKDIVLSKESSPTAAGKVAESLKSKSSFGKGLSRAYVYKWIGEQYPGTSVAAVRRAITKGIAEGTLQYGKTNARFLLTKEGREKWAPKKKKTKKKAAKKPKKASKKKKKKTTKKTSKKKKASGKKKVGKKKKVSSKKTPTKKTSKKKAGKKKASTKSKKGKAKAKKKTTPKKKGKKSAKK